MGSGGSSQYFSGAVDDVRVYNRPLTAFEVQQLYNDEAFFPLILSQPTNMAASLDESVSLTVEAEGAAPLNYQWQFNGTNIAEATNSTLALTNVQFGQAGTYAVVITNSYGLVTSSHALLTVVTSPVIESQPQDESVLAGSSAKFSVVASSSSALTYQWTLNRNDIPGATSSTISLINVQPAQAGAYAVVISNSYGSITSSDVLLTVVPGQEILTDGLVAYYPFAGNADDESGNGNDLTDYGATLCADRFGNPNGAYFFDGSSYLGSTNSPLSQIDNWTVTAWIQPASIPQTNGYAVCVGYDNGSSGDGYAMGIGGGQLWVFYPGVGFSPGGYVFLATNQWYHVVMVRSSGALMLYVNGNAVTNGGAIESQPTAPTSFEVGSGGSDRYFQGAVDGVRVYNVAFTALEAQALYNFEATSPPLLVIQSQPTNEMAYIGGTASFTVEAAGMEPLIYQWTFNGTNIAGATNAMLVLMGLQPTQIGTYSVVVGNSSGSVTSSNALLGIVNFPIIEVQPQSQGVLIGGSATLSVTASGTGLTYQWLLNNFLLPGQTDSTLVLSDVNASAAGEYTVLVMNDVWPVISSPAILSVFSGAAFLDASTFTSLGVFNPVTNVVVDVGSGQMSGGASFKGSNVTQAGTSVLVFTFSSFVLDSGLSITFVINGAGSTAVALLSQGNMTIGGVIDAGGLPGGTGGPDANGPGPDGGEGGGYNYQNNSIDAYPGNGGGADSSDLTAQLDGGSAGGTGAGGGNPPVPGSGGGGGGALQIGALGSLTVNGAISVNGGGGAGGLAMGGNTGSGGGGSGGGLLVQAGSVAFGSNAVLSSDGGAGGPFEDEGTFEGPFCYSGGGGGGGRIVVAYSGSGMSNGSITALGGAGGDSGYPAGNGAAGTVVFAQALVPALPSIAASIDSLGKFVLSWPSNATNYVLQTSPVLGERAVWNPVGGAVLVGNDFVLTNRTLGAGGFFRLKGK
ncbi:MAG TPA: immunoglobulin domain-containing protein [Candidatus Saccharimonadales bacterium]|nr:immunoglobulin domain-containing protein [Candidatus Saccharimonadales bacterium]